MMYASVRRFTFDHPSPLDIVLFTRHLATMTKAGIPLAEALRTLASQMKSKEFKRVIGALLIDIENGQSLAHALEKHPRVFDRFYGKLIEISEASGTLDKNLEFIATELYKNYSLKKKIQAAFLYPTLIFVALVVMGGFVSFFVLPHLLDFFAAFDMTLPVSTRILLFVATLFKNYGVFIAIFFLASFIIGRYSLQLPAVLPIWHSAILRFPVIGEFLLSTQLAQFSRNLGVLIKSGVPVVKSITITAETLSNVKFREDLLQIGSALNKGKNIATAMEKGGYREFPPLVVKMIAVGEQTGKLDDSLLYLGDYYEEEIDGFSKNLTTLLEPMLLLSIGLVVGFMAIAIITPIYELSGSIR